MKIVTLQQRGGTVTYVMDREGNWFCVTDGARVAGGTPLHNTLSALVRMH